MATDAIAVEANSNKCSFLSDKLSSQLRITPDRKFDCQGQFRDTPHVAVHLFIRSQMMSVTLTLPQVTKTEQIMESST